MELKPILLVDDSGGDWADLESEFAKYRDIQEDLVKGRLGKFANAKRNDPCPCGKGRKFKKCCWGKF
jgi:uncharacterized protein YecA (UPF0149 family)